MRDRRFRNGEGQPVVALDLDGTLGNYHKWFLQFAEMYFGRPMPNPAEINPGMPLYKFMGIKQYEYRDCKLAYRQGGMKRGMPVYEGASRLSQTVRKAGAELWLCTTRPYLRLDNIDPDTREWLHRHHIEYDAVLFDGLHRPKYEELVQQIDPERIVAVVDDLPEQIASAGKSGVRRLFLRDQPYNRSHEQIAVPGFPAHIRVMNCAEIQGCLLREIEAWKECHQH